MSMKESEYEYGGMFYNPSGQVCMRPFRIDPLCSKFRTKVELPLSLFNYSGCWGKKRDGLLTIRSGRVKPKEDYSRDTCTGLIGELKRRFILLLVKDLTATCQGWARLCPHARYHRTLCIICPDVWLEIQREDLWLRGEGGPYPQQENCHQERGSYPETGTTCSVKDKPPCDCLAFWEDGYLMASYGQDKNPWLII